MNETLIKICFELFHACEQFIDVQEERSLQVLNSFNNFFIFHFHTIAPVTRIKILKLLIHIRLLLTADICILPKKITYRLPGRLSDCISSF